MVRGVTNSGECTRLQRVTVVESSPVCKGLMTVVCTYSSLPCRWCEVSVSTSVPSCPSPDWLCQRPSQWPLWYDQREVFVQVLVCLTHLWTIYITRNLHSDHKHATIHVAYSACCSTMYCFSICSWKKVPKTNVSHFHHTCPKIKCSLVIICILTHRDDSHQVLVI